MPSSMAASVSLFSSSTMGAGLSSSNFFTFAIGFIVGWNRWAMLSNSLPVFTRMVSKQDNRPRGLSGAKSKDWSAVMLLFALSIVLFPFVIAPGCAQGDEHPDELVGGWKGVWTKDGDSLPVTVTFTRAGDAYSGMFDSDALQVAGIPLDDVSGTHGSVHFQLRGDQSTTVFDGTITGAKMSGTFTDGSVKGSFELARAVLPAAQIRARDVTFQNKDTSLAGTLWLPDTPGKHAAIVFLHGSGPEGRWANRYLAQKFAQHGIVALIYDKRGVGQSTGDWQKATFEVLG